jgi:cytochrome b6-f complex iron-sulfur subunit
MTATAEGEHKFPESVEGPSRRSFLSRLWVVLGTLALAELVALVVMFLNPRRPRGKSGVSAAMVEAGPVKKFATGSVTAFVRGKFYLARLEDGGFLALSRTCTHLGCSVPWRADEKKFVCPCHASAFDIRGEIIRSPAPRALDMHPLFIENNIVKVDTGRRIRRSGFRADQVVHPRTT